MSKLYATNPAHAKAALVLSSMSDDMISDIVSLVSSRGSALIAEISSNKDRGLSPLAIFSRNLMSDEDFEEVWVGFNTITIASMRTLKSDFDFYESTLQSAFGLPPEMAAQIAKTIETYDIVGATAPGQAAPSYMTALGARIAEQIRKIGNWSMDLLHLPFENDQDQRYDIDFLYELKLLGRAVGELNSRARLMNAQASIAAGMGLFKPSESGDIADTPFNRSAQVGGLISPLLLSSLPNQIFGRFAGLARMGKLASTARAKVATTAAGLSSVVPASLNGINNVDPGLSDAFKSAMAGDVPALAAYLSKIGPKSLASLLETIKATAGGLMSQANDVAYAVGDVYGDEAGSAWARGDVAGVMEAIGDLASVDLSTGDPDLDETIIGDVLGEIAESGDLAYGDAEIGGLLKRARINAAIRRGNRYKKRTAKKVSRAQTRANEDARLENAKRRLTSLESQRSAALTSIRPVIPDEEAFDEDFEDQDMQGWANDQEGSFVDESMNMFPNE